MLFFSKQQLIIDRKDKIFALNLVIKNNLTYLKTYYDEKENLIFEIDSKQIKEYKTLFKNNNITFKHGKESAAFRFIKQIKYRYGIILGALFLVLMVYINSNIVWQINVIGNKEVSKSEIISILDSAGFSLGKFIPNIDYGKLHNRILLQTDKISWVSININGSVANVELKEVQKNAPPIDPTYSNIVAKSDGYIFLVETINGEKVVKNGQIVKEGDLLISGIINSNANGVRYVDANGRVFAYTNKDLTIEIPIEIDEKVYTGKIITDTKYKLFSKYINFSLKNSKYNEFYDKIEEKEPFTVFGLKNLPIEKQITKYYEYKTVKTKRSYDEVVELAFQELEKQINDNLDSIELISKNIKTKFDGERFYIFCNMYCKEDIAKRVQFSVNQ